MRLLILLVVLVASELPRAQSWEPDFTPCISILKRYHECKHLKMRLTESGEYEIDSSVANNELGQSFYDSALGSITLSQALDLQRDIYSSARDPNCTSELCRCARPIGKNLNWYFEYAFFRPDVYVQFKLAALEYVDEFRPKSPKDRYRIPTESLKKFCSNYNILVGRVNEFISNYINIPKCIMKLLTASQEPELKIKDCIFQEAHELNFRYFLTKSGPYDLKSKSEEDKVLTCFGKTVDFDSVCTLTERRFLMAVVFPTLFKNIWTGETNLTSLTDSLALRVAAKEVTSRNKSAWVEFNFMRPLKAKTLNGEEITLVISNSRDVSLFRSPVLNLTASFTLENDDDFLTTRTEIKLKSVTISSVYDLSSSPRYLFNRTFDLKSNSELPIDSLILNPVDQNEKIWIRCVSLTMLSPKSRILEFFDFKWNVSISTDWYSVRIQMPESVASQAQDGLFVNALL